MGTLSSHAKERQRARFSSILVFLENKYVHVYYITINISIGFISKMYSDLPSFPDPPDILEH